MSVNNDLQKSLLDSMQLLAQNSADSTAAVKSIKATVKAIKDAGAGIYELNYGGNVIEASAANLNVSYQVGDNVYVLIPDGDFSQSKIIIGLVASRAANYSPTEEKDKYTIISDNLLSFVNDGLIKLKSWGKINEEGIWEKDYQEDIVLDNTNFNILFPSYLTDGDKTFVFSAKVKTDIDKDHQSRGNYGLILKLPFKDAGTGSLVPVLCSMDVNTMLGNPYAFTTEQDVNLYFTIKDGLVYDSEHKPELLAFVEGFGYADPRELEYDIYFKDVQVQMVEEISEPDQNGYYLALVSNKGNYFFSGNLTDKTLIPKLKLNGKDTDLSNWECYWFAEDASIKNDSDGYTSIGGLGWKCLNNKTNISYDDTGKQNYLYAANKYSYAVKAQDIESQLRYKCVLIQDDVVVSATITLKNLTNNISMELVSKTGSNTYIENIGNVYLIARLKYPALPAGYTISTIWQRYDQNGNYLDDDFYSLHRNNEPNDDALETEIYFPCSLVDKANIIRCTFYCSFTNDGVISKKNLGTASIKIYTTAELSYSSNIENGDVVYKYDSDGDSPLTANYDGPVNSRISTIKPLVFRIYKEDGRELEDEEYAQVNYRWAIPINSMIVLDREEIPSSQDDNYYYIEGIGHKNINYTIANSFSKRKNDNTVLFSADFAGNKIQAAAAIKFLKDGESGTNGTKYIALIYHAISPTEEYSYNEKDSNGLIRKVIMVYNHGNWYYYNQETKMLSTNLPSFGIKVYSNGDRADDSITPPVYWQMFDAKNDNNSNRVNFKMVNNQLQLADSGSSWEDNLAPYTNVIQAKVTVKTGTNATEIIYAYYPIEIIKVSDTITLTTGQVVSLPQLNGGFDNVTYASDGKNPQYDDSTSFTCVYAGEGGLEQYYGYDWSAGSQGNITIEPSSNTAKATPVNNFESGCSKNYVQVRITSDSAQSSEIDSKTEEYENQITEYTALREKYRNNQGYMQSLLDKVENFSYNNITNRLSNSQLLLLYRYKCIRVIDYLNNDQTGFKETIYKFCESKKTVIEPYFDYQEFYNNAGNKLTVTYKQLYNLLTNGSFADIDNLQSLVTSVDEGLKDVDLSAYVQLSSLIDQWNTQITTVYKNAYDLLIIQGGLGNLQQLSNDLQTFTSDSDLLALEDVDGQEFENLRTSVATIISRLADYEGQINSYDDYINGVIKPLYNLFFIYQKSEYQKYYYGNIFEKLNNEIELLQKEYDNYNKSIAVTTTTTPTVLMTYVKPIVMLFNRYEMSYLNDWDGNKIYTGSSTDNSEYLFAPQVGAGRMEYDQGTNTHQFTGITIGVKKSSNYDDKIGLFGYGKGAQSIFLNAKDGSAEFGASGAGQILVKPGEAPTIYTAEHNKIDSNQPGFYLGSNGLSIGSQFKVSNNGVLRLGYQAYGTEKTCWEINANGSNSYIGYKTNSLKYTWPGTSSSTSGITGSNGEVYLGTDGIRLGSKFAVDKDGNMSASNVWMSGHIKATAGSIGGWSISNNNLTCGSTTINGNNGSITIGNYFSANTNGVTLTGSVTSENGNYKAVLTSGGLDLKYSNNQVAQLSSAAYGSNTGGILTTNSKFLALGIGNGRGNYTARLWINNGANLDYSENVIIDGNCRITNQLYTNGIYLESGNKSALIQLRIDSIYGGPVVQVERLNAKSGLYINDIPVSTGGSDSGVTTFSTDESLGNDYHLSNSHRLVSDLESLDEDTGDVILGYTRNWCDTSDIRLKDNIKEMPDFTKVYMQLHPKQFTFKNDIYGYDYMIHYNIMAQDFQRLCKKEHIPLINTEICCQREPDYKSNETKYVNDYVNMIDLDEFHALHIQMIQKQQRQIEALQQELREIKEKLNNGK